MQYGSICLVKDMRALEENSAWLGVSTRLLMENAGSFIARTIYDYVKPPAEVCIFAGTGGKAGDGFVAARHLAALGYHVKVFLISSDVRHQDAKENLNTLKTLTDIGNVTIYENYATWIAKLPSQTDVVIDALIGVGFKPPLREPYRTVIDKLNNIRARIRIAIDVPSGVEADTGSVDEVAFKADITITMHCIKKGLTNEPARSFCGKIIVANIGIPESAWLYVGPGDVKYRLPEYKQRAHKGAHGKILVIGGSREYIGAPWLTALAALYAGADLVYLASISNVVGARFSPEIIPVMLEGDYISRNHVAKLVEFVKAKRIPVVVIGPGISRNSMTVEATCELVKQLNELNEVKSIILDADALWALTMCETRSLGDKFILTPHLGEARHLLGISEVQDTLDNRIKLGRRLAKELKSYILLKGWVDVIAAPNGVFRLNRTGHPQMTVGGTGDVLVGLLASLVARGMDPFDASCIAAFLNGLTGQFVAEKYGRVTPMTLIKALPKIVERLKRGKL